MAKNPYIGKIGNAGPQIVKVRPDGRKGSGKVHTGKNGRDGK